MNEAACVLLDMPESEAFAKKYALDVFKTKEEALEAGFSVLVCYHEGALALQSLVDPGFRPLAMELDTFQNRSRLKYEVLCQDPLIKAIGKKNTQYSVWDLCFGLGRDSLAFAAFGFDVHAFERSPILVELWLDSRKRLSSDNELNTITRRIDLNCSDSRDLLSTDQDFEIIYLDPMFPAKRNAKVRKEIALINRLIGTQEDPIELFELAYQKFLKRLVVKRPLKAPHFGPNPDNKVLAKSHRFDIYLRA